MVTYADKYLLTWEAQHRFQTERWRDLARRELAGTGIVPNETTMRAWKKKRDEEERVKLEKDREEEST